MLNRGITSPAMYLHTTEAVVFDPELLDNMKRGAALLLKHISQNNKIYIQIDEDCDGYTSAAVLINYLNTIAPHFTQNNIIYKTHDCKAHGVVVEDVPEDVSLVIIPDAGSNQYEEHAQLAAAGKEILILDHHNADRLPPQACLINNQTCLYPNKALSGVGIVYKFCCYLDSLLGKTIAPRFLDLVAVGMVADMMPLNSYETKHFVSNGLNNIINPFIQGMVIKNEFYLKGKLTPHGVSFCIAPAVNAIARVGSLTERRILFESMLEFCAYDQIPSTKRGGAGTMETKVEQACRNCTNVRNRQNKDRDHSLDLAENLIDKYNLLDNPVLFIQFDESAVNENLTGLIANQIAAKYNRPTLVLNPIYEINTDTGEAFLFWRGSARNVKGTKFEDFQKFLLNSNLVEYAAGHANAFGVSIPENALETLKFYCKTALDEKDFTPIYKVDAIYGANTIDGLDILSIGDLTHLWGEGMEEPLVAIKNLQINGGNLTLMKGPTIKITPANREDGLEYIMFKTTEDVYQALYSEYGIITIDLVGTCARNDYTGRPQIVIKDFEIVKKQDYYF